MANYFCTDSVEEQVDYLTDQVKDLNTKKLDKAAIVQATGTGIDVVMSQKAVTDEINGNLQTVNESLQTINTELNGKLTKPTNPSAESAVTMLADGTVGTKLLSEIGGGGKLYLHKIELMSSDSANGANITIINSRDTPYPRNTPADIEVVFKEKIDKYFVSGFTSHTPVLYVESTTNGQQVHYFATNGQNGQYEYITLQCCMDDTVTEL